MAALDAAALARRLKAFDQNLKNIKKFEGDTRDFEQATLWAHEIKQLISDFQDLINAGEVFERRLIKDALSGPAKLWFTDYAYTTFVDFKADFTDRLVLATANQSTFSAAPPTQSNSSRHHTTPPQEQTALEKVMEKMERLTLAMMTKLEQNQHQGQHHRRYNNYNQDVRQGNPRNEYAPQPPRQRPDNPPSGNPVPRANVVTMEPAWYNPVLSPRGAPSPPRERAIDTHTTPFSFSCNLIKSEPSPNPRTPTSAPIPSPRTPTAPIINTVRSQTVLTPNIDTVLSHSPTRNQVPMVAPGRADRRIPVRQVTAHEMAGVLGRHVRISSCWQG